MLLLPSPMPLISELNARGTFTSTVLAVTVLMDVVVVVLFSVTLSVARTARQLDQPQPTTTAHLPSADQTTFRSWDEPIHPCLPPIDHCPHATNS